MKFCPKCGTQLEDNAGFCSTCGANLGAAAPAVNPYDHTGEFSPEDVSDNKAFAMLLYLAGVLGLLVALIASRDSAYLKFHLRQGIKILVVTLLSVVLCVIPFLGWIVAGVWSVMSLVITLICFFRVCAGKSIEAPIVRSFGFLK